MIVTLDWLGVATFRLIVDEQVIFLDAYMDRVPAAPSFGLRAGEVDRAESGAYAYLIETPEGSIRWKGTSGHWTGILRDLRPDVAILAAAGRGNIDGEPIQGSLTQFMAREADLLHPGKIVLCHHDDWNPPVTGPTGVEPIREELARQ